MKKLLALMLAVTLALSLCACGIDEQTQQKLDLYEKYAHFIDLMEAGDYETLILELLEQYPALDPDGGDDPEGDDPNGGNQVVAEPNENEKWQLLQYAEIFRALNSYANSGSMWVEKFDESGVRLQSYSNQAGFKFCYETLQTLTAVDQWWNCEYVTNNIENADAINWDRHGILNRFTVVKDVLLSVTEFSEDKLGNVEGPDQIGFWEYDALGRLSRFRDPVLDFELGSIVTDGSCLEYEYDEAGRLVRAIGRDYWYGNVDDKIESVRTYEYSDDGTQMIVTIMTNTDEYVYRYTYDEQGRLLLIENRPETISRERYFWEETVYTYDDDGKLIEVFEAVYHADPYNPSAEPRLYSSNRRTYAYDENGALASSAIVVDGSVGETYTNTFEYVCDELGRVVQEKIIYSTEVTFSDVHTIYEYIYGNYYTYTPAQ